MANKDYIERLQQVIFHMHGAKSVWVESVPVTEIYQGKVIWDGIVEVFSLGDFPKAKHCYAWSFKPDSGNVSEQFVAVLEIPPVDSPYAAVKVAVANEVRKL